MQRMRWLVSTVALLAVFVGLAPVAAQKDAAVEQAINYIRTQQQADGSFAGLGPSSTADAIYALAAADVKIADIKQGGASPIDFIKSQAKGSGSDTGVAAKYLIAMLLAGQPPRQPDGTDLVAEVQRGYNAQTGQYGKDVTAHAYALIGLIAAGSPPAVAAVDALKKLQLPDGGWSFDGTPATGSDTNTTALAVQALAAVGDQSDAVTKAVAYFKAQQNADGGFPYSQSSQFGTASDANSTALSIQALVAADENLANYAKNGKTPTDRLRAFQNQSGAFRYQDAQPDDNQFATYQAAPALLSVPLPLEPIAVALPAPSATPTAATAAATAAPAPTAAATPAPTLAPTTPAGGGATQLPNTGAQTTAPLIAVLALVLLISGIILKRRRA